MSKLEVLQGKQEIRRGEGLVFSLTVTNWDGDITDTDPIVITRVSDSENVTADFTGSPSTTYSGAVITLPEITAPTDAQLGDYRVDVPFSAGGFGPGRPYFILRVVT